MHWIMNAITFVADAVDTIWYELFNKNAKAQNKYYADQCKVRDTYNVHLQAAGQRILAQKPGHYDGLELMLSPVDSARRQLEQAIQLADISVSYLNRSVLSKDTLGEQFAIAALNREIPVLKRCLKAAKKQGILVETYLQDYPWTDFYLAS